MWGEGAFLGRMSFQVPTGVGGAVKSKGPTGGVRKKSDRGTKRSAKALVAAGTKSSDTSSLSGSESDSAQGKAPAGNGDDLL